MKILADEDVDKPIVDRLRADGHDVAYINDKGLNLKGSSDVQVGQKGIQEDRLIVTKNKNDFLEKNFEADQPLPSGVLALDINRMPNKAQAARVSSFVNERGDDLKGKVTVLEPGTDRSKPMDQAFKEFKSQQQEKEKEGREL